MKNNPACKAKIYDLIISSGCVKEKMALDKGKRIKAYVTSEEWEQENNESQEEERGLYLSYAYWFLHCEHV